MVSENKIKNIEFCKKCPYYLTEKDKHIEFGKGDLVCKTVILLNKYGNKLTEYYFKLLKDLYKREFNRELTEDYYITYLPKCYKFSVNRFIETEQITKHCIEIFVRELDYYCKYYNCIVVFDDILSNILQSYNFQGSNLKMIYSKTPTNTYQFIKEFKTIIANDRNLGI